MTPDPYGLPAQIMTHAKRTPLWGWAFIAVYLIGIGSCSGYTSYVDYANHIWLRDHGLRVISTVKNVDYIHDRSGNEYFVNGLFHYGAPGHMWRDSHHITYEQYKSIYPGQTYTGDIDPKNPTNNIMDRGYVSNAGYASNDLFDFVAEFGMALLAGGFAWWVMTRTAAESKAATLEYMRWARLPIPDGRKPPPLNLGVDQPAPPHAHPFDFSDGDGSAKDPLR